MIRSFKDRRTWRFFKDHRIAAFQGFADQAARRLTYLDSAESLTDLAGLRSNRLESLRDRRSDNTAHGSTRNGESVFVGKTMVRATWRSWMITEEF